MANRCYWLSATEVAVQLLTGGDCLQTHNNQRLFTRQLQWALQECKRSLNGEGAAEDDPMRQQSVEAVTVQFVDGVPQPVVESGGVSQEAAHDNRGTAELAECAKADHEQSGDDTHDEEVEVADEDNAKELDCDDEGDKQQVDPDSLTVSTCTSSTNSADDFAHRGSGLQTMPYYVYRMYVRRQLRGNRASVPGGTLFDFEPHYPLARLHVQVVQLDRMDVPTIDGFQCPTWTQDSEQNALLKSLLFTPWACQGPLHCGCVSKFAHLLSDSSCKAGPGGAAQPACDAGPGGAAQPAAQRDRKFTFERAWRLRCSEIHVLAERAEARSHAAKKFLVLADTILFAKIKEPKPELDRAQPQTHVKDFLHSATAPHHACTRASVDSSHGRTHLFVACRAMHPGRILRLPSARRSGAHRSGSGSKGETTGEKTQRPISGRRKRGH